MSKSVLLFVSLLLSYRLEAAVFDRDDRLAVSGGPFAPVGVVYPANRRHYATGFLVDRCHVLTVKHVVGENKPAQGKELRFSVGPRTMKGNSTTQGKVVADGKFRVVEHAGETGQGRFRDWLLLRLNHCLGDQFGYLQLSNGPLVVGQKVESVGFPIDRSLENPTLDPDCKIRALLGSTLLHDCASRPGVSGGAIFRRVGGTIEVVAMHSAGVPDRGIRAFDFAYSSIAIPVAVILPAIIRHLKRDDT